MFLMVVWVIIWFRSKDMWEKFVAVLTCMILMIFIMVNMYFFTQSKTYQMALSDLEKGSRRPWGHLFDVLGAEPVH